jgi:hypothetical protein
MRFFSLSLSLSTFYYLGVVAIEEADIRGFATAMEGDPDQKRIQAQARKTPKQLEDVCWRCCSSYILTLDRYFGC